MNSKEKRKKWPFVENGEVYQSPVEYEVLARMTKQEVRLFHAQVILKSFREACTELLLDERKLLKYLDEFGETLGYLCVRRMAEKSGLSMEEVETVTKLSGFWMRDLTFVPPDEALQAVESNLTRFLARHRLASFLPLSVLVLLTTSL